MSDIQFHAMADGRRIAFRAAPGAGPMLVFLPGYMSDMSGGKATAVFDWAKAQGRAALLLDYSGCGASSGDFADGTLSLQLVVPKELGGPGGEGANPEKLFALGYSACFLGALRVAATQSTRRPGRTSRSCWSAARWAAG